MFSPPPAVTVISVAGAATGCPGSGGLLTKAKYAPTGRGDEHAARGRRTGACAGRPGRRAGGGRRATGAGSAGVSGGVPGGDRSGCRCPGSPTRPGGDRPGGTSGGPAAIRRAGGGEGRTGAGRGDDRGGVGGDPGPAVPAGPTMVAGRPPAPGGRRHLRHLPLGRRRDRRRHPPGQRGHHLGRRLVPVGRLLRHHLLDDRRPPRRARPGGATVTGRGGAVLVPDQLLGDRPLGERRAAGEQEVERRPERVDVGPDVHRVAVQRLLRGEVVGRARGRSRRTSWCRSSSSSWKNRASPMSRIFTTPARSTRMFPGLMSRWMSPISWACWRPTAGAVDVVARPDRRRAGRTS